MDAPILHVEEVVSEGASSAIDLTVGATERLCEGLGGKIGLESNDESGGGFRHGKSSKLGLTEEFFRSPETPARRPPKDSMIVTRGDNEGLRRTPFLPSLVLFLDDLPRRP